MLKFTVDGQKLELLGDPFVVADSFDFLTGSFKFYSGHDWELTEKHVFFQLGEATPYEVTLVDDEFVKTDHVNLTTGVWSIYVIGYDIDGATLVERITTNKVSLTAQISGVPEGEPFPPSIIPDVLIVKDQTAPQTFINGVPRLAADRVIENENDMVDAKHVADVVAAVTADDFAHNSLSSLQGGSATERYHMTAEQNTALHAHANKAALDNVTGTNTGDQAASSFDHNDLANKQGGTTNEFYHVTAAEKTVIQNTSGMNTGDQVLPTRDSLGLDMDDNVTFANLSGMNTGDQDVSGAISTHNTDAGAHASLFSIIRDGRVYTLRWDRVNAKGVRLNNAQGISTTITNFCHRGTANAAMDNPFDSIYPWDEINLCNISIDEYRALAPGSDIRDCAVSWLGDVDFSYGHENGVYVFRPEHFVRVIDDGPYRYIDISNKEIPGSVKQKARMEGRYFGVPYALTIDGVSKTCLIPKPGMPGKNIAMSTLHTYAKNWGATLENIYGYSDANALMAVEYATLNSQDAVGNGASDLYRQSGYLIKAAASNAAVVKILTADASTYCIAGTIFDIGTTDGNFNVGSFIIASTALDADPTYTNVTLTTDGITPASVTVTTAHYWSVHGLYNAIDSAIGAASGYIGTNGRCNAYYRGQIAHANMFRYVLGAYRKSGNGGIWIANSEAEADAYDALNQGIHHDTGLILPQGAGGAATSGYIQTLGLHDGLLAPLCTAIGGGSINPVGDYCYAPSLATGDTVLIAGGYANVGTSCGRFYGFWSYSAANAGWLYGAVPVLKTPV